MIIEAYELSSKLFIIIIAKMKFVVNVPVRRKMVKRETDFESEDILSVLIADNSLGVETKMKLEIVRDEFLTMKKTLRE